jgi:hypothetical protein
VPTIHRKIVILYPKGLINLLPELHASTLIPTDINNQPKLLHKAMYGLPESAREFYEEIRSALVKGNYKISVNDPCLFYKFNNMNIIFIICHVDDFAIAYSDIILYHELLAVLSGYIITPSDQVDTYLGIHFTYYGNQAISFSQPGYLESLFIKFHIDKTCHNYSTPMDINFNDETQNKSEIIEVNYYLSIIGSLIHAIKSRPDILFAVNRLSRRAKLPTQADYTAALRVLKYLYHTRTKVLIYRPKYEALIIIAYTDAAHHVNALSLDTLVIVYSLKMLNPVLLWLFQKFRQWYLYQLQNLKLLQLWKQPKKLFGIAIFFKN